jgi:photosystem II stability/assembly factor-like uncharacterized protein
MMRLVRLRLCIVAVLLLAAEQAHAQDKTSGPWVMQSSETKASLRGIHAVGGGVAWASGTNGTVLRTEDGGYMWQSCAMPPGAEKVDFRGIWAWDEKTAVVMSSGPGDLSRLYKTTDGCSHWTLLFTNPDKDGFWDAVNCADQANCVILGDPVGGRFSVFEMDKTADGAVRWNRLSDAGLQSASGEGAFAASNSSLMIDWVDGPMLFGTGGPEGARIFLECEGDCGGRSKWTAISLPSFSKGAASGIFSIDYRDWRHFVVVGGDYKKPSAGTVAWTTDGGKTWTAAKKPPHGYRSAVAWDADAKAWIAVGTNGSDISYDDGKTWSPLDDGNWNALSLPWVVGPEGRIAKLGALPARK